ncbi:hypothetical protein MYX65_07595 [Acidobacteria bacterium AH-259-L09]|nr:hypothetical protein [Acidobacteria bacterium AH-259-L09]
MSLVETITDTVIEVAASGNARISACAAFGVSCEGWLKVELLTALFDSVSLSDTKLLSEADNVDLTVQSASEKVLIELKTFPTNYQRGGGKPITNFVAGVVKDLNELSEKRGNHTGVVVWMAYIIPEPVPPTWPNHLAKIEAAAKRMIREERIPLWENAFANLYIMESK